MLLLALYYSLNSYSWSHSSLHTAASQKPAVHQSASSVQRVAVCRPTWSSAAEAHATTAPDAERACCWRRLPCLQSPSSLPPTSSPRQKLPVSVSLSRTSQAYQHSSTDRHSTAQASNLVAISVSPSTRKLTVVVKVTSGCEMHTIISLTQFFRHLNVNTTFIVFWQPKAGLKQSYIRKHTQTHNKRYNKMSRLSLVVRQGIR